ncbi:hypothetical protein F4W66_25260 (plasmid) [Escherichia coli]|nr:hypothetical protein F4W66_25260 [Escherichia coli]
MKRYDDEGKCEADHRWWCTGAVQDALYQAEQAMDDLPRNFEDRVVLRTECGSLPDRTSLSWHLRNMVRSGEDFYKCRTPPVPLVAIT